MAAMTEVLDELQVVFGEFGVDDAVDEQVIDAAARRLGALPSALRLLYARTGNNADLHRRTNELVTPSELVVREGFVTFYLEEQGVCEWAVAVSDLAADDPPVYTLQGDGAEMVADADFGSITEFFALQTVWQTSNGEPPFFGLQNSPLGDPLSWSDLEARLGRLGHELASSAHGKVWVVGEALVGFNPNGIGWFGIAAQTSDAIVSAMESVGLSVPGRSAPTLRPGSPD